MTRIFTDGAEMGDLLFFSGGPAVNVVTIQAASGVYSYRTAYPFGGPWKNLDTPLSEIYFKERIYRNGVGRSIFIEFRNGTKDLGYVSVDTLNRWIAVIDGVTLRTSIPVCLPNNWYCLEVHFKIDGVNGAFDVTVDGNVMFTFSGDTTFVGGEATVDNLYWSYSGAGDILYFDDLALNDTAGGVDDSWCGGGRVIKLKPIGDGTPVNAWDGSDGNKIANWEMIDEIPKDDDVTYIYTDAGVPGTIDQYIVEDYSGTDRAIGRIWAEVRARKTLPAAAALKIGFDTTLSVHTDDVGILNEAYDLRLIGPEYLVNPDDTFPWEEADLDLLQLVVESG